MKSALNVIFGLLVGLASFALWGTRSPAEGAASAPPAPLPAGKPAANAASALDLPALRAEMHTIARQEIAAANAGKPSESGTKSPAPEASPEQKRAAAEQSKLLARAIEVGVWTDQDVIQ